VPPMCRPNYETITNGIPVRVIDLEEKSVIHDEVIFEHGIARDERPNREETLFYYVSQSLGQGGHVVCCPASKVVFA
jgi:hypothetical protein